MLPTHRTLWWLPVLYTLVGLLVMMSNDSAAVATFSTSDPSWPIDARTAFQMLTAGGEPKVVTNLEWTGKYYNGEAGSGLRFRFRVYGNSADGPGRVIAERDIDSFSTAYAGDGALIYTATIPDVSLPVGTTIWVEIQAEGPAVPQWGLVSIQSLPTEDVRLIRCPELGLPTWSEYAELGFPRGNAPHVSASATDLQAKAKSIQDLTVGPNPSAGSRTLRFSVSRSTEIKGGIYDVAGRRVRTLCDRTYSPGRHSIAWDGHTDQGVSCRQGVYFLRLVDDRGSRVQRKIMVVREVSQ